MGSWYEAGFFVTVTESEAQQRALLEKFVDEALATNKRNCIQGDPPMIYREMIVLASDVTRNYNGKQDKADVGRLEAKNKRLKTEISNLKMSSKVNNPPRGGEHSVRTPPRRPRRSGQGQGSVDVFHEDRKDVSAALML